MSFWPWGLLSGMSVLAVGCDPPQARLPMPPIDAAAPAVTETATFALG